MRVYDNAKNALSKCVKSANSVRILGRKSLVYQAVFLQKRGQQYNYITILENVPKMRTRCFLQNIDSSSLISYNTDIKRMQTQAKAHP